MNSLNEQLRAIRTQKSIYEKQASELNKKIKILTDEEAELLRQLGAYDLL